MRKETGEKNKNNVTHVKMSYELMASMNYFNIWAMWDKKFFCFHLFLKSTF